MAFARRSTDGNFQPPCNVHGERVLPQKLSVRSNDAAAAVDGGGRRRSEADEATSSLRQRRSKPLASTVAADAACGGGVVAANDWAAVQCQTSVNWAPRSWFWNHFSGGLNHQVRKGMEKQQEWADCINWLTAEVHLFACFCATFDWFG